MYSFVLSEGEQVPSTVARKCSLTLTCFLRPCSGAVTPVVVAAPFYGIARAQTHAVRSGDFHSLPLDLYKQ